MPFSGPDNILITPDRLVVGFLQILLSPPQGVRESATRDMQPSLGWNPTMLPGSPIRVIERNTQGVGATEWLTHFLGKLLHIDL